MNLTSSLGCKDEDYKDTNVAGAIVAVARGNCTFLEKALVAQRHEAIAVLSVSKTGLVSIYS